MANKYIVLSTQDGTTINKWFRIMSGGYQEQYVKSGALDRTVDGGLDIKSGKVLEIYNCAIRVRHTEQPGSPYGTKDDIITLFKLADPTDPNTPNRLLFTDHYGQTRNAYLFGEMSGIPVSTIIEGTEAWFVYQVTLVIEQ